MNDHFARQMQRLTQETEAMTKLVAAIGEYARVATEHAVGVHMIFSEQAPSSPPPADTETKA